MDCVIKRWIETRSSFILLKVDVCFSRQGYKDEMLNPEMQPLIPVHLYGKSDLLFGNMEEIFRFHNEMFLRDLENCIDTPELIGLCFVQRVSVKCLKFQLSRLNNVFSMPVMLCA